MEGVHLVQCKCHGSVGSCQLGGHVMEGVQLVQCKCHGSVGSCQLGHVMEGVHLVPSNKPWQRHLCSPHTNALLWGLFLVVV